MLKMRHGAELPAGSGLAESHFGFGDGGLSVMRTTPWTISSTYVKSRTIFPSLNTGIGSPARMPRVNLKSAMSGRPHGPYTVKKRSPVDGMRKRGAYECAIASFAFLVAA